MALFCTDCGVAVEAGKKFCLGCGARIEAAAPVPAAETERVPAFQTAPAYQTAQPVAPSPTYQTAPAYQAAQPIASVSQNPYSGRLAYDQPTPGQYPPVFPATSLARAEAGPLALPATLGYLLVMNIPLLGLVMSIVWGAGNGNPARRNLARAMIVISAIWNLVLVAGILIGLSVLKQIAEVTEMSFSILGIKIM